MGECKTWKCLDNRTTYAPPKSFNISNLKGLQHLMRHERHEGKTIFALIPGSFLDYDGINITEDSNKIYKMPFYDLREVLFKNYTSSGKKREDLHVFTAIILRGIVEQKPQLLLPFQQLANLSNETKTGKDDIFVDDDIDYFADKVKDSIFFLAHYQDCETNLTAKGECFLDDEGRCSQYYTVTVITPPVPPHGKNCPSETEVIEFCSGNKSICTTALPSGGSKTASRSFATLLVLLVICFLVLQLQL